MKELNLVTPIPPSVNHYMNYRIARGRKLFIKTFPSPETVKYQRLMKQYIPEEIKKQNWNMLGPDEFAYVYITFYFERKRKDSNNYLKVPFDCFTENGVWYDDDKAMPVVTRVFIDKENPRAEFTIKKAKFIGAFDSKKDYNKFLQNNCSICTKNSDKCTILKTLLDNKITVNADQEKCFKIKEK